MILSRDDQKIVLRAPYGAGGAVTIPGSKSISNRALILAALSTGVTDIKGLLHSFKMYLCCLPFYPNKCKRISQLVIK